MKNISIAAYKIDFCTPLIHIQVNKEHTNVKTWKKNVEMSLMMMTGQKL